MTTKLVKHTAVTIIPPKPKQKALTVKLRAAIEVFARAKACSETGVQVSGLIDATLAAYRMDNEELFEWLDRNRYRWDSSRAQWKDLRRM